MQKVYTIGETVFDLIFKDNEPIAGKAGGSVLNASVSLGRLNIPVFFISEYGKDKIGSIINDFLCRNKVNTGFVYRYEGKSSLALAFLDDKNNAAYNFYKDLPENRLQIDLPEINENDIVLFGSFYAINKEVRAKVLEIIKMAKEKNAILIYDPNFRKSHSHELEELRPLILENMQLADIVRTSDEDCEEIFGAKTSEEAYNEVSKYCPNFIYTANQSGVFLHTQNTTQKFNVKKIKPVSTIGAGDTFNAGIIFHFLKENFKKSDINSLKVSQWKACVQTAVNFATEVCLSYDNYISIDYARKMLNG